MNFLGHSYFKGSSTLFLVGNICGDFYKGSPTSFSLPDDMVEGIKFHRKLDILTDSSSAVGRAKKKLSKYGIFSGIIVDIFYDHFLAVNLHKINGFPLGVHTSSVYSLLLENSYYIPLKSKSVIMHMIEEDWFGNYRDIEFIEKTLRRVSKRISRKNEIFLSVNELQENYDFFQENFLEFWDEINNKIKKL